MTDTATHINTLRTKLRLLLKNHADLIAENARQKKQIAEILAASKRQVEQLELLRQQNLVLKVSADAANPKEKKELEQKINGYLRNIEKCISLLSHKSEPGQ